MSFEFKDWVFLVERRDRAPALGVVLDVVSARQYLVMYTPEDAPVYCEVIDSLVMTGWRMFPDFNSRNRYLLHHYPALHKDLSNEGLPVSES